MNNTLLRATAVALIVLVAGCGGNNTYNPNLSGPGVPSFKLAAPGSITLAAGGTTSFTVKVTSLNGFSNPVDLTASGLPAGATASFAPSSVIPTAGGASSTVTITLPAGVQSFNITITGTSGGVVKQTTVHVNVSGGGNGPAQIAFESERSGNRQIYVMNADGSAVTRLTNNSASDGDPVYTPNGAKIVFYSTRDGGSRQLYIMNADGSGQTRLTNSNGDDNEPEVSPNGLKIAFSSTRDGNNEIYVMNLDGSGVTRLTNESNIGANNYHPSWSPDGTRITFASDRDDAGSEDGQIYVMNADGSNQTRLTFTNNADENHPRWSRSNKIAFYSVRDEGEREIYVMNADGSNQTRITNNDTRDDEPAWSSDSSKIAFRSRRDANDFEIYVMNPDGSGQTRLTNSPGRDAAPYWKP